MPASLSWRPEAGVWTPRQAHWLELELVEDDADPHNQAILERYLGLNEIGVDVSVLVVFSQPRSNPGVSLGERHRGGWVA